MYYLVFDVIYTLASNAQNTNKIVGYFYAYYLFNITIKVRRFIITYKVLNIQIYIPYNNYLIVTIFIYIWVHYRQEVKVMILLICLTPQYIRVCPRPGPTFVFGSTLFSLR